MITRELFGVTPDGKEVELITVDKGSGIKAQFITLAAALKCLDVKDGTGKVRNVVLGHDDLEGYLQNAGFIGDTIGRFAGRIAKAAFTLDGTSYEMDPSGRDMLHGGRDGYHTKLFGCVTDGDDVIFSYSSPDGESGFPGRLDFKVTYSFTGDALAISYEAVTDKPTPVNFTNHSYFNLGGGPDILSHLLTINAPNYAATDDHLIPTGEILPVAGTALDFTAPKLIGRDIGDEMLAPFRYGYDHTYVLGGTGFRTAAVLTDEASRLSMEISTDQPALQLYSAGGLREVSGSDGEIYNKSKGVALETQHIPDAPNHPGFPDTILRPGEVFKSKTVYTFKTL